MVMSAGYASIVAQAGESVHGVLWRIQPGDLDALDRYEDVAGGLYDRCTLTVQHGGEPQTAMTYVGRSRAPGRARIEYCELLLEAARDWELPAPYVAKLARELPLRTGRRGGMSASVIRHVIVRGTVQGVGFRAFVQRHALERGLTGWVRNRRDGSVEAVLAGPVGEVDAALEALRKGPSSAKVKAVLVSEAGEPELRERLAGEVFSMLRTV